MLATSINEAGYSVEYFALLILIILSSNGCRITSSTFRENSGNSSKRKKWYHCNSLMVSHKAPKSTKTCTIGPFTTIKIHNKNVFPKQLQVKKNKHIGHNCEKKTIFAVVLWQRSAYQRWRIYMRIILFLTRFNIKIF